MDDHAPRRLMIAGLRERGFDVWSLEELRCSGRPYPTAIPLLVRALDDTDDGRQLGEIVRTLSVPWARPAALPSLIALFRRVEDPTGTGLRWTVGNALEVLWDDRYFDELVDLARLRQFGRAREMVVLGLARSGRPAAAVVALRLCDDPDVNGHALSVLARKKFALRVPDEAASVFERMSGDHRAWVRTAASRGLRHLA